LFPLHAVKLKSTRPREQTKVRPTSAGDVHLAQAFEIERPERHIRWIKLEMLVLSAVCEQD
jgi:hypothetical protein